MRAAAPADSTTWATVTAFIESRVQPSRILAVTGVGALVTGATPLWWAASGVALLGIGHVALVARVRRLMAEREMSIAFAADPTFDWGSFARSLSDVALQPEDGAARAKTMDDRGGPVKVPLCR